MASNIHVILNSHMVDNAGASPVWGLIAGALITMAERRALKGNTFEFHMSDLVTNRGPLLDRFTDELASGSVGAVLAIGLAPHMRTHINQYGVPVIGFCGAGNHLVVLDMHTQIENATSLLVDSGCRRLEFWSRALPVPPPSPFSVYDIIDTTGLVARFQNPGDRVARRILDRVSPVIQRGILSLPAPVKVSSEIKHLLCDAINAAEFSPSLWDEATFDRSKLKQPTLQAIDNLNSLPTATFAANRLLIQNTFTNELRQLPYSESHTVNAFRAELGRRFPDDEPARVRYAEHTEVGDVGNQMPSYNLARAVFGGPNPHPDGLLIDDDMAASGVHRALEELGLKIGVDVKIATHANAGSAVGFALHGRTIQILFEPTDFVHAMFEILDSDSVGDLERPLTVHVQPRVLSPGR